MNSNKDLAIERISKAIDQCVALQLVTERWARVLKEDIEDTLEVAEEHREPESYFGGVENILNTFETVRKMAKKNMEERMVN